MLTRRQLLLGGTALAALPAGCARAAPDVAAPVEVNDLHSALNPTRVARVVSPSARSELGDIVRAASLEIDEVELPEPSADRLFSAWLKRRIDAVAARLGS